MPELSEVVPAVGRLRREPRQARSRARLAQILAAADAILAEEGVEALTIRRIAAGVQRVLAEHAGVADGDALELAARSAVRAADALLQYAFARVAGRRRGGTHRAQDDAAAVPGAPDPRSPPLGQRASRMVAATRRP